MNNTETFTTDQGPSADNQTSDDHGLDSNQKARHQTTREILEAEGLDRETEDETIDLSSARIKS